jgi:hypothetical protein
VLTQSGPGYSPGVCEVSTGRTILADGSAPAILPTGDSPLGDGIPCTTKLPGEVAEWLKAAPC